MTFMGETLAYTMNCKMLFNDTEQMRQHVQRMWACAESERDYALLEYMQKALEDISNELRIRLDN